MDGRRTEAHEECGVLEMTSKEWPSRICDVDREGGNRLSDRGHPQLGLWQRLFCTTSKVTGRQHTDPRNLVR